MVATILSFHRWILYESVLDLHYTSDTRSYIPPVKIGEVMRGWAVGQIKASRSPLFADGSYATGLVGWVEHAIVRAEELERFDATKNGRLTDALGVLGKAICRSSSVPICC